MPKVTDAYIKARRRQILDAAIACFSRNGFHQTTVDDICREAGLSPGAIYRYFSSKDDIVEACWQERQRIRASRFEAAQQKRDTLQIIDDLVSAYLQRLDRTEAAADMRLRIQYWAESLRSPRVRDLLRRAWDDLLGRMAEIIRRAQSRGEISADLDPETVAPFFLATFDGLVLQKTVEPELDLWKFADVLRSLYSGGFWHGPDGVRDVREGVPPIPKEAPQ